MMRETVLMLGDGAYRPASAGVWAGGERTEANR
ncbi:MAG: hypothetical protein QOI66_5506 [Myxococcales bacterium]|nr:hypothetical protein [Myxococcales bacterium]